MNGTAVSRGVNPLLTAIPGLSGTYAWPQITVNAGGQIIAISSLTTYTGNLTVTGTLNAGALVVTGTATFAGPTTFSGTSTFNGLTVTGVATFSGPTKITGASGITAQGTSTLGLHVNGATGTADYSGIDFSSGNVNPQARIAAVFAGGGSSLVFATSNNYSNGITNTAITIGPTGVVTISASAAGANSFIVSDGTNSLNFTPNSTCNINVNNALSFNIAGNAALTISSARNVTFSNAVGVNNNSPPAQVTGWGTPTGGAVVLSFPSSATLAQCGTAIAKIITDLKAFGLYGA